MRLSLTVYFDDPFWVGLFERVDGEALRVARVVFGAEPTDQQVHALVLTGLTTLRFSPPVEGVRLRVIAANPKRRQRQAARAQTRGTSTKSQQAMQLAHEEAKQERHERSKAQRELDEQRRFALHIEKKKEKHRGR